MRVSANAEGFLRDPIGRYLAGRTWLAFCWDETVSGMVAWGQPDLAEVRAALAVVPGTGPSPLARRAARVLDIRMLESPDWQAFQAFVDHLSAQEEAFERAVSKLAVVHARGMAAALAAGLPKVAEISFSVRLFDEPRRALEWLDVTSADKLFDELDRLQAAACGVDPLVRDLRALLASQLRTVTVRRAAADLRLSPRTLQRRLQFLRTSFQNELDHVRVEVAQQLLRQTKLGIKEVAFEVGCASASHFSELFARLAGVLPSEWRGRAPT
jgi:AraC-like DNA-binding protein